MSICKEKMLEDLDISQEEMRGSCETSIFSPPELTLHLHLKSSTETPLSRKCAYDFDSARKLEITVYKVLNMDICISMH